MRTWDQWETSTDPKVEWKTRRPVYFITLSVFRYCELWVVISDVMSLPWEANRGYSYEGTAKVPSSATVFCLAPLGPFSIYYFESFNPKWLVRWLDLTLFPSDLCSLQSFISQVTSIQVTWHILKSTPLFSWPWIVDVAMHQCQHYCDLIVCSTVMTRPQWWLGWALQLESEKLFTFRILGWCLLHIYCNIHSLISDRWISKYTNCK